MRRAGRLEQVSAQPAGTRSVAGGQPSRTAGAETAPAPDAALAPASGQARTLVAALGQAFAGDDGVGLAVAHALREELPPGVEIRELADPARLVELGAGRKRLIVVDALLAPADAGAGRSVAVRRAQAPADRVLVLRPEELERRRATPVSSHGLGVADALALLAMLHQPPPEIVLVGVVIDAPRRYRNALTPAAAAAVPAAVRAVRELLAAR